MSELRQNLASRNWVIIAAERLKGKTFESPRNPELDTWNNYEKNCPFCPANKERFPSIELDRVPAFDSDFDWKAICIENKYKIMGDVPGCPVTPREFEKEGIYNKFIGCGNHELVIESPIHNKTFAVMDHSEVVPVIELYVRRYIELGNNPNNLITIIFKNHGQASGASQQHPHSQIIASRVVPNYVRNIVEEARRYFDNEGVCVHCKIINHELKEKKRIVYENEHFVTISPYAAPMPFQLDIYPKKHESDFRNLDNKLIEALSDCIRVTMRKLYIKLGNPDFNIIFRNPPYQDTNVPYCHWFVQIAPHCIIPGGFELGSRMNVNIIPPEQAAEELKNIKINS
jgi:UDPglucose--hexose-1-phosphate uridylyltransferase